MSEDGSVPVQARVKSSGLSIGDVARLAQVRASAIRYYEQRGLLPAPPRRSGRREYSADAVGRLRSIVAARRLGFSIREIERLAGRDREGRRDLARSKARELRALIANLGARAARLDELAACDCDSGGVCRV